jgi:large subunit ribosomal protein L23
MSNYRDIIKEPIITEKTASLTQNENTIVFSVDTKANKTQIKQAVENIFDVKVESVNTINATTKKKRVGKYAGRTNRRKKAIVKLAEGSSIELN